VSPKRHTVQDLLALLKGSPMTTRDLAETMGCSVTTVNILVLEAGEEVGSRKQWDTVGSRRRSHGPVHYLKPLAKEPRSETELLGGAMPRGRWICGECTAVWKRGRDDQTDFRFKYTKEIPAVILEVRHRCGNSDLFPDGHPCYFEPEK